MNFLPLINNDEVESIKAMDSTTRDQLKHAINSTHPHHIFQAVDECRNPDKCKIICPVCGNGSGDDSTPVEVTRKGDVWLYNCFKCDSFSGDLLKIIAREENLNLHTFEDLCRALAYGANLIKFDFNCMSTFTPQKTKKLTRKQQEIIDNQTRKEHYLIADDIANAKKNLNKLPRGDARELTFETLQHFDCGYIEEWIHPKIRSEGKKAPPTPRLIIPSGMHYNAVALPSKRQNMEKKYFKMHAGNLTLFNTKDIDNPNFEYVLVVEGEIDAMSIWQVFEGKPKMAVVAVLGAANWKKTLLPIISQYNKKKFIILFDGDESGRNNAELLRQELLKKNIYATSRFLRDYFTKKTFHATNDDKLDANDILRYIPGKRSNYGAKQLFSAIDNILESAKYEFALMDYELLTPGTTLSSIRELLPPSSLLYPKYDDWQEYYEEYRRKQKEVSQCYMEFGTAYTQKEKALKEKNDTTTATTNSSSNVATPIKTSGDATPIKTSGDTTPIKTSGDTTPIKTSGDATPIKTSGDATPIKTSGDTTSIKTSGDATPPKTFASPSDKLKYLKSLPSSPERDSQLLTLIRNMCEWKLNRKGERLCILPTIANMKLIFENDPNLSNLVGFDEFQGTDVLLKDAPWKRANNHINREWNEKDDAQLRLYLRENYAELQGKQLIEDMVVRTSQANSFNAVKKYFQGLPKWDGIERAESLFIKYLRVDDTPYAREVTMNWLLGAVARIFHPGCRYQTALVLHGNQKIGKSYLIERLGNEWYLELTENVEDTHAADAIQKGWLIEIKEMSAMRKSELNAVKAFIERSNETRRAAYERKATTTYRHCVFAITVNDSEFLRDVTGNRRYLILHCNSAMFNYVEGLTDDCIRQIWAEVYQKYNELFDNDNAFDEKKLLLSRHTESTAEEIASNYLQDDGLTGEIKGFLEKKIPPPFIWNELTREERRQFFARGYLKIVDFNIDIAQRRLVRGGKNVGEDIKKISEWLDPNNHNKYVKVLDIPGGKYTSPRIEYYIYGSEFREHVCAAEIYNECFDADKRKSMRRFNEILLTLEGWKLGARLTRADSVYSDQKKPFYRAKLNYPQN